MAKTKKRRSEPKVKILEIFLGILNAVKLYHWSTFSYAKHKATDELYSRLNEHIDKFVEVMMGKTGRRIPEYNKRILATSGNFTTQIHNYRDFLMRLGDLLDEKDTDLLSIRDEILADINQFLYLMTLTK